jgi:acyl carrier protein
MTRPAKHGIAAAAVDDARAQALLDFVRRNFGATTAAEITVDTPLLAEQVVDSMGITLLAAFIEEHFDVAFDGTELRKGRLETIGGLVAWLDRRS